MIAGVARVVRESTRPAHASAEQSPFVTALLAGALPLPAYADLLRQWQVVYQALEDAGERFSTDAVAGPFVDPALRRSAALRHDLAALDRAPEPVTGATARYARRIAGCTDATAFVAHHYTRYLGDLSGGQVIGRAVRHAFGLVGGGASFFDFDEIVDPKAYKDAYRARLDAAAIDAAALAAEVAVAYAFNAEVFAALAERHLP